MKPLLFILSLFFLVLPLTGEAIEDMELYKQLKDAQANYEKAYEEGDFDSAQQYADEVKQYATELTAYLDSLEEPEIVVVDDTPPVVEPEPEPEPQPVAPELVTYEVKRGDTLWDIAAMSGIYSNPYQWPEIYKVNKNVLNEPDNPDLIHAGMIFEIPVLEN